MNTKDLLNALAKLAAESFPMHGLTLVLWYAFCKCLLKKKKKNQTHFPGIHRVKKHSKTVESPWYFQGAVLSYLFSLRAPIWEKQQFLKCSASAFASASILKSETFEILQMCVNTAELVLPSFSVKESSSPRLGPSLAELLEEKKTVRSCQGIISPSPRSSPRPPCSSHTRHKHPCAEGRSAACAHPAPLKSVWPQGLFCCFTTEQIEQHFITS